jgi:hypothetical protein
MKLLNCTYIIQFDGDVEDATFVKIFCITNHYIIVLYTPDPEPLTNFGCSYNKKFKIEVIYCILNDRKRLLFRDGGIWASYQNITQKDLSLS